MKIDREEASRVAKLARLEFDAASLERMAADMTAILGYVDQLREVDVSAVTVSNERLETPTRPDEPHDSLGRDAVAANAPSWDDGFFVVPPVIGGEP